MQAAVQKCKSRAWGLILSKTPLPGKGYKLPPRDGLAAAAFRLTMQGEKCKAEKLEECFALLKQEESLPTHLEAAISLLLLLQNSSPGEESRGPTEVGDCVDRRDKVGSGKYSHYSEAMFQFSIVFKTQFCISCYWCTCSAPQVSRYSADFAEQRECGGI